MPARLLQRAARFRQFESVRRDRLEKIVKHGARSANSKAASPVGRVIRDLVLPIAFPPGR